MGSIKNIPSIILARELKRRCKEHAGCVEAGCVFWDYDEEGQIVCKISMFDDDEGDVVIPMDWKV